MASESPFLTNLLSVPVPKLTRVRSPALAAVYWCGSSLVLVLAFVYLLVVLQGQRLPMGMSSTVRLVGESPGDSFRRPAQSLPYCEGATNPATRQWPCAYLGDEILELDRSPSSVSLVTAITQVNQTIAGQAGCAEMRDPTCRYQDIASDTRFVAQAELFLVEMFVASTFSGDGNVYQSSPDTSAITICRNANSDRAGAQVGVCADGTAINPCDAFTRLDLDCPDVVTKGTAIPLNTLLEAATGDPAFLDRTLDTVDGVRSQRELGLLLSLQFEFTNLGARDPSVISHIVRPRIVKGTSRNYRTTTSAFSVVNRVPAYFPTNRVETTFATIRVELELTSDVSENSVSQAIIVVSSAIGFMAAFQQAISVIIPSIMDRESRARVHEVLPSWNLFTSTIRSVRSFRPNPAGRSEAGASGDIELAPDKASREVA